MTSSPSGLPLSVWSLALAMGIGMSGATIAVRVAAEFGQELSNRVDLATLPTGLQVVGVMLGGLVCSRAMGRFGRKPVLLIGLAFGILAGIIGIIAAWQESYLTLFPAHFCLGLYLANIALLRFTAADQVVGSASGRALSLTLFGGVLAAFVGPGFVFAADQISSAQYYGISYGFIALIAVVVWAIIAATPIKSSVIENSVKEQTESTNKPVISARSYMSFPYITAVLTGAVGYCVMALLMTAAALYMKDLNASVSHAGQFNNSVRTFAIMWHVVAMFAPMIFLPKLAELFGLKYLMLIGAGLLILSAVVSLIGTSPAIVYTSLILLGFGWAATYGTGGILVKQIVHHKARFAAQGRNEFIVALFSGVGSVGAGPVLLSLGWQTMNWMAIGLVALLIPLILMLNLRD